MQTPTDHSASQSVHKIQEPIEQLIAEFESMNKSTSGCKVCDCSSDLLELVNTLFVRGASGQSMSTFLNNKFKISISSTTLLRHNRLKHHVK